MNKPLERLIAEGFSATILERFWSKVQKTESCWLWTGATNGRLGYGKINICGHGDHSTYAHRVSWLIHKGSIPDGQNVLHNCPGGDNPACVNPDHLFLGTKRENSEDMARKGRSHKGYKLTDEQVLAIICLRKTLTGKAIAERFGISMTIVSQIVHCQRYKRLWAKYSEDLPPVATDQRKNLENYRH